MTDDYVTPDGTMTPADLSARIHPHDLESGRAWARGDLQGAINKLQTGVRDGFLAGIADALRGVVRAPLFQGVADAFEDGQAALVDRLDLLDGVRGYCQAYMSRNVNGEWGVNNTRALPFDAPLGPSKGAHVDAAQGSVVMDESGLWTVHFMVTARQTSYTASWFDTDSVRATMRIHRPDGSVYSHKIFQALSGKAATTLTASIPVVVPSPGYYITIEAYSSRWRWWDGGTKFSALSVIKHDNSTINPGTETVPDETQ